jgi:methionyl-tRNA formyltransferase
MSIIFCGTDGLAVPALRRLSQQPWCDIRLVITPPDQPLGRKQLFTATPIKRLAEMLDLPVQHQAVNLPPADVGVVVYYGKIIGPAVLRHFQHGIVNIHPSLLPRWRGPAPIKSAIWAGDSVTGVTIMLIDAGVDTGPILAQRTVAIRPTETAADLEDRLGTVGADVLIETLPRYYAGQLQPVPQQTGAATYSRLLQRSDGELQPSEQPLALWNHYRALQPWPGVFVRHRDKRYKITAAHWADGQLMVDRIQPEGKKAMTLAEFKRGYPYISIPHGI